MFKPCKETSQYAVTGVILAKDRPAIMAFGHFYINDRGTHVVLGQQPFGESQAGGADDRHGADGPMRHRVYLRTIKKNFATMNSVPCHFIIME